MKKLYITLFSMLTLITLLSACSSENVISVKEKTDKEIKVMSKIVQNGQELHFTPEIENESDEEVTITYATPIATYYIGASKHPIMTRLEWNDVVLEPGEIHHDTKSIYEHMEPGTYKTKVTFDYIVDGESRQTSMEFDLNVK